MQNYAISSEKSNVFSQFSAWRNKKAQEMSNKEVNKIISLRNDKTHADEALMVTRIVLLVVTAFTAYCGFLFYQSTFGKIFTPSTTLLAAVALAFITEAAKIFLTHRALRSIFFGWMFRSFWNLGGWLFIAAIGVGAYVWSVNISTDGMDMFTRQITEISTPKDDLNLAITAATSGIDAQIDKATNTQSEAFSTKWRGTTTVRAQKIAETTAKSIASLQTQRQTLVDQVTADHKAANATRSENISNWAYWIERYGGYMELVAGLCLFAIVFFERRLVAENINVANSIPTPPANTAPPQHRPASAPLNGNTAPLSESGLFQNSSANPVRDSQTLTGTNGRQSGGSDGDFIRLRLKGIKGWDDNFGKPGNKPETVANNMCKILNEIGLQMTRPDFRPDENSVNDLLTYVQDTGYPTLKANGYHYVYADELTNLCRNYLQAAMAAA